MLGFAEDLRTIADTLGIGKFAVIGLSGGGPYTLACRRGACPTGWWWPQCSAAWPRLIGADGISGRLMELAKVVRPMLEVAGTPVRWVAGSLIG